MCSWWVVLSINELLAWDGSGTVGQNLLTWMQLTVRKLNLFLSACAGEHSIPIDVGPGCTPSARMWHRGDSKLHYLLELAYSFYNNGIHSRCAVDENVTSSVTYMPCSLELCETWILLSSVYNCTLKAGWITTHEYSI